VGAHPTGEDRTCAARCMGRRYGARLAVVAADGAEISLRIRKQGLGDCDDEENCVLFGMENTFPGPLVEKINSMEVDGITAEFVEVGGVAMAKPSGYAVIVDRISHDVPFYRSFLKNAVLTGTQVINNPFWWSADDKFFNYALAEKIGVAAPRTVLIPHKYYPPMTTEKSFRNLQ